MVIERRFVTVDGMSISYLVAGEGAVIMLLPGVGFAAQDCVDLGYIEALASDHRVIAIDLLAHGESDGSYDPADFGDEALMAQLDAVADAEHAATLGLVGFSWGAEVAQRYARRRVARADYVACLGTFMPTSDRSSVRAHGVDPLADPETLIPLIEAEEWERLWELVAGDAPGWIRERIERFDPKALVAVVTSDSYGAQGYLASPVPVLAIWGRDGLITEANMLEAEALPLEYVLVSGDERTSMGAVDEVVAAIRVFEQRVAELS